MPQSSFPANPGLNDYITVIPAGNLTDGIKQTISSITAIPGQTYNSPILNGNITYTPVALGTTGTVSWSLSKASTFTLTPTGDMTLNATNLFIGQDITLIILTSGATSYTITFGTGIKSTGTLATGTGSGKYFIWQGTCDGNALVETLRTAAL